MFVRRMATVTISAPEATTASRVSRKSRYLPVPTRSRDRYARPAMTNGSVNVEGAPGAFMVRFYASASAPSSMRARRAELRGGELAAPYRADDLEAIAAGNGRVGVAAARDDLAVSFHGDA